MKSLLLLGLLLADPPPAAPEPDAKTSDPREETAVRPAVPVPESGLLPPELSEWRRPEWGVTAAVGMGGIIDRGGDGVALWGGVRRWVGDNAILGGVASFQQFSGLNDLALLARFELATRTERSRLFPSFSVYAGAGPEWVSGARGASGGLRLVIGTHLPSIWSALFSSGTASNLAWSVFPFLILPMAIEVQFRTGSGTTRSSTTIVFALAL